MISCSIVLPKEFDREDVKALEGKLPLIYMVRNEWGELAEKWVKENTPSAEFHSFGSHMMFGDNCRMNKSNIYK